MPVEYQMLCVGLVIGGLVSWMCTRQWCDVRRHADWEALRRFWWQASNAGYQDQDLWQYLLRWR